MKNKTKKTKDQIEKTIISPMGKKNVPIHIVLIGVLLLLNGLLIYPLFLDGFSRFIENIESAHITNAKFVLEHLGINWNNVWYFGFPTHLTYPPLVPYLIALVAKIFSLGVNHSYRIVTAIFVFFTPLSIYTFIYYLTNRKTTAFLTSLMYILLPSIAYLFIPQIVSLPSIAGYPPYQWIIFAQFGEGPHLVALFFTPLAALYFIKSYREPDITNYILAAVFVALTMLANLFAGFALMVILALVILGKLATYTQDINIKRLIFIGLLSYALTAFYFDYSFIQSILESSYIHPENAVHLPPFLIMFVAILFGILPLALFLRHKLMGNDNNFKWFLMLGWMIVFLGVAMVYYHTGYSLVTQPNRYLPEAQIGFVALLAMLITALIDFVRRQYSGRAGYIVHTAVIIGTFVVIYALSFQYITNPYFLIKPVTMDTTHEYQIAQWFDENIDGRSGERAYLTGTPAFWLNVFTDTPQIRGGADNAQPNPWWADIAYQINKGDDPALVKAWLQILNIKYILINYPESGTHYVDYENFGRFADYPLAAEFADGGFKILTVPDSQLALFSINNVIKYDRQGMIKNKVDNAGILDFAKLINEGDHDRISYVMNDPGYYQIEATNLQADESIIVKTNYDIRWQAVSDQGQKLTIQPIGPNFIEIKPNIDGDLSFTLQAIPAWSEYLGIVITLIAVLLSGWLLYQRRKKLID
ncbi:MAG: hypothetical protein WC570_03665 [Patescibacteria group bacterium]